MAYRRSSIIARTNLFYQQQQRISPSFSHISSSSNREESSAKSISRNSEIRSCFLIPRNNAIAGNSLLSGMRSNIPAAYGLIFHRNLSNIPVLHEAAPVVVNEVAIAAADSPDLVAAFMYLTDYVHCYTGFQWWGSIAATALLMRFIHLPFRIYEMKYYSRNGGNMKVKLCSALEYSIKMWKDERRLIKAFLLFAKANVNALGVVLVLPVIPFMSANILCLAILNMTVKVPSFATGGTLWFMDLTIPDHSMCLPILFALSWLIRLKLNPMYRVEGFPSTMTSMKSLCGALAILVGSVTAEFPSAIYCYGITSNLFSIAFAKVMMDPRVPKALGISMKPPSTDKNPFFK